MRHGTFAAIVLVVLWICGCVGDGHVEDVDDPTSAPLWLWDGVDEPIQWPDQEKTPTNIPPDQPPDEDKDAGP